MLLKRKNKPTLVKYRYMQIYKARPEQDQDNICCFRIKATITLLKRLIKCSTSYVN
jgi:hypothetical protein